MQKRVITPDKKKFIVKLLDLLSGLPRDLPVREIRISWDNPKDPEIEIEYLASHEVEDKDKQ